MCPYSRQSKHLVPLLLVGHFAFRWFLFPHRKHRRTGSLAASSRLVLFDLSPTRLAFVFAFSFVASYRASFSFNFVRHEFRRWCILFFIIFFIIFYYGLFTTHSLHYVEHFVDILLVCLGFLFGSTQVFMHFVRIHFLLKFGTQHFLRRFSTFTTPFEVERQFCRST